MKKLISIVLLLSTSFVFASTDDNEIKITQSGDTLELYIDQIGYGNKVGGDDFSSGSGTNMSITGSSLVIDLDFTGNSNVLFGPVVSDSSNITLDVTGDSNTTDWNIGYIGSADSSDINFDITGDSNTFDIDQGYEFSAERLDADLILLGSSNAFDVDFESDDNVWTLDVTGDSNNINTLQNDGAQNLEFTFVGDSGDVDISQISGTCANSGDTSCTSPNANIVLDVTSDNAIIQLVQKDQAGDS